jgi:hypothetical protein
VIVLHAIWSRNARPCVWGEDGSLPSSAPRRRGRPPVRPRPRRHPFAAGIEDLARALGRVCPQHDPAASVAGELSILLPSHEHGPQASPHLLRADDDGAAPGRPDRFQPWLVTTATFDAADAVEFLLGLPRGEEPGLAIGDSSRFLAEIAKLALELLARGRVMPTLARSEDRWVARWEPVATDPGDAERLRLLAGSIPPLLRAEAGLSEHSRTPEKIVDGALGAFVDACARRYLAEPLLPRAARGRAPAGVESWITALTAADPVVAAEGLELAALSEQLDAWRWSSIRPTGRSVRAFACPRQTSPPRRSPRSPGASRSCCRQRTTRACLSRRRRCGARTAMACAFSAV